MKTNIEFFLVSHILTDGLIHRLTDPSVKRTLFPLERSQHMTDIGFYEIDHRGQRVIVRGCIEVKCSPEEVIRAVGHEELAWRSGPAPPI